MKLKIFLAVLCIMPLSVFAAERTSDARIGVKRMAVSNMRGPTAVENSWSQTVAIVNAVTDTKKINVITPGGTESKDVALVCRDAYRDCMDEFCLLDKSEGDRCACSSNINLSKQMIIDIKKIQADADKLYTEGIERENLGAKVRLVFGESEKAKKSSRASGLSFTQWLNSGSVEGTLGTDADIGDDLYYMAASYCRSKLNTCVSSTEAEMEEALYSRLIVQNCKEFNTYLGDQKKDAEDNKKIAEAAVRAARFKMLDTTNKYNGGECLLAYKSCISDKGGCGVNFENCLDADLLGLRAKACENVLDQCTAARDYVIQDWATLSKTVLADAAIYADENRRATCFAKIQLCLEDRCSTETNSGCLTNINIAVGICPIITECDKLVPGIKDSTKEDLGALRLKFCQNDVDKCFQDKCGKNYNAPECMGKKFTDIKNLCPQSGFKSCKGEEQFDIIVQSVMMEMDYQQLAGCTNHYATELGKVCGTDMSCLPDDTTVSSLMRVPTDDIQKELLYERVRENSRLAVTKFFDDFNAGDAFVVACRDAKKPTGRRSLQDTVAGSAKQVAEIAAENRAVRALDKKLATLEQVADLAAAEKKCYKDYKKEPAEKGEKNYSYIKSVVFEPALSNCHVCRMQQVCEVGGESKGAAGTKGLTGGLASGAAMGTMVMPGWGTAIGGIAGAVGGWFSGKAGVGGEKTFCQQLEVCEDINIGIIKQ